jgi:hypothetical protein
VRFAWIVVVFTLTALVLAPGPVAADRYEDCANAVPTEIVHQRSIQVPVVAIGSWDFDVPPEFVCADLRVHVEPGIWFPLPPLDDSNVRFFQNGSFVAGCEWSSTIPFEVTCGVEGAFWPGSVHYEWFIHGVPNQVFAVQVTVTGRS